MIGENSMQFDSKAPGVYKEEVFLRPRPALLTGVPGLVGFASVIGEDKKTPSSSGRPSMSQPVMLHRKDEFEANFKSLAEGYLADAVNGFFLNEGSHCYVVAVELDDEWNTQERREALKAALETLAPLTDLDLIAIPDAMTLGLSSDARAVDTDALIIQLQQEMLEHCAKHKGRMAILDALPGRDQAAIKEQRKAIMEGLAVEKSRAKVSIHPERKAIMEGLAEPMNGALYYPWIKNYGGRVVPPCGHVAGIFARSDSRVGVFKAPANEEVKGALDLEFSMDDKTQTGLNPLGINCLRSFPGRGIRVWGARTLHPDPNWRYINVRRLFLTLQRWIDLNMAWTSFEPNTPVLWVRIERELNSYLSGLWNAGALMGESAEQAFYVKCDDETNTPDTEEAGQVITEIGLAASAPAEYIVVRVVHHTGMEPR